MTRRDRHGATTLLMGLRSGNTTSRPVEDIERILRNSLVRQALRLAWLESQAGASTRREPGGFVVHMTHTLDKAVLEDERAMSLARAMAAANDRARREGVDLTASLVTAVEHARPDEVYSRFSYGPRDYIRRRGGDLSVDVGLDDAQVRRVLRGQ